MDTLNVLLVDDEPGIRHSITRALRRYVIALPDLDTEVHFQITEADTGEAGLERVLESKPDLLLLDYKLPGISGLEVLEKLAQSDCRTLTIMVTAYASLETAIRATKSGAFDFLAKPFTPAELKSTVRKAAEHYLVQRRARELAEEKQRVKFEFIRVLGHELKAPLSAIEGYLNILRDRAAGRDINNYDHAVDRCLRRTEGMRKLIMDLLDMTKIEAGEKKRELARIDLVATAKTALDTVLPEALRREVTIDFESSAKEIFVWGDATEIEIIFNNLLSNAVKYNRDRGNVTLTLRERNGNALIRVTDTGIGMTHEDAERLFRDFVRIKNSKTRDIPGSGLGLSLVRKLARAYGGDATVESTPDVGSTFTVTLNCDQMRYTKETDGATQDSPVAAHDR